MFAGFRVHGLKKVGDPDFLYAAPDTTACAVFFKENRMKCAEAASCAGNPGEVPPFLFL
jgi:hypothetical protein